MVTLSRVEGSPCGTNVPLPPVNRITHTSENITLPHTMYEVGKNDIVGVAPGRQ